ncbi:histidine kinase [Bradyrhizobium sp. AS23.2]|uniref:type III secretion apparatus assembly chaperone SctY n=1 Tax=Bradyrhizobium sp. AS23.2 TaxID=1680155 RepID=UPI00093D60C7|nr:histidine kinase [Bradyrhizobium sp. AS23.2]OKO80642.1 histidine kinase [Bradyrhizobium sp. AS23.2]
MAELDEEQHLTPPPPNVSKAGEVLLISRTERDLLCALSYIHLECGQSAQSLALLRIAAHEHSQNVELLRILVYALISEGHGDKALAALDRLDKLDEQPSSRLPLMVLRSHALRQAGRMAEARAIFKSYVSLRSSAAPIKR